MRDMTKLWGNRVQYEPKTFKQLHEEGWPEKGKDYEVSTVNLLPDEIHELNLTGMVSVTVAVSGFDKPVVVTVRDWQRWEDWPYRDEQ